MKRGKYNFVTGEITVMANRIPPRTFITGEVPFSNLQRQSRSALRQGTFILIEKLLGQD